MNINRVGSDSPTTSACSPWGRFGYFSYSSVSSTASHSGETPSSGLRSKVSLWHPAVSSPQILCHWEIAIWHLVTSIPFTLCLARQHCTLEPLAYVSQFDKIGQHDPDLGEGCSGPGRSVSNGCIEILILGESIWGDSCNYRRRNYMENLSEKNTWL